MDFCIFSFAGSKICHSIVLANNKTAQCTSVNESQANFYLRVSKKILVKKNHNLFAIRAVGNSMNNANINGENIEDGDYVIVDFSKQSPSNGAYILSVIDVLANIKKYKEDSTRKSIILLSESTREYPPIILHKDDVGSYHVAGEGVQIIKV